jgi:hypothetical protein
VGLVGGTEKVKNKEPFLKPKFKKAPSIGIVKYRFRLPTAKLNP